MSAIRSVIVACIVFFIAIVDSYGQNVPVGGQPPAASPLPVRGAYNTTSRINLVREWGPNMPVSDPQAVTDPARTIREIVQVTRYYDGLGRPLQVVSKKASPSGKDVVAPVYYDDYGKSSRSYLPYVANQESTGNGLFKADPFTQQTTSLQAINAYPGEQIYYGTTEIEASALSRVVKTTSPGNSWAGNGVGLHSDYNTNTIDDEVQLWRFDNATMTPYSIGAYAAGELLKQATTDESGKSSIGYTDKAGRLVLKKVQAADEPSVGHEGWICTYYVYDDLGNLSCVISPGAVSKLKENGWTAPDPGLWDKLCYRYTYDARGRSIVKKAAGAGEEYLVYDRRDRLVFSQDANQRAAGQWIVMFYDELNRPVMTALYNSPATREQLQARMDTAGGSSAITVTSTIISPQDLTVRIREDGTPAHLARRSVTLLSGFESKPGDPFIAGLDNTPARTITETITVLNNPLPGISNYTPLAIYYYDNYKWKGARSFDEKAVGKLDAGGQPYAEEVTPELNVLDHMTGKQLRVLSDGQEQWISTTIYYDKRGRQIQRLEDNIAGGIDVTTIQYDFSGSPLSSYLQHSNPASKTNPETRVLTKYTYDDVGRLLKTTVRINDDAVLQRDVVKNVYDELGRLQTRALGDIESLEYEYNIRGWLKSINKDYVRNGGGHYFGMELFYDYGYTQNELDGNLAGITWRRKGDDQYRSYGMQYDPAGRLAQAYYTRRDGGNWQQASEDYSVSQLRYDANGNIGKMNVQATVLGQIKPVDKLNYTYQASGNRLEKVVDSAGYHEQHDFKDGTNTTVDYTYDGNGNLLTDANKGISLVWNNVAEKPVEVHFDGQDKEIRFIYDAGGTRWKKIIESNNVTTVYTYINGFTYRNDTLLYFNHAGGRVRRNYKGALVFDYFVADHQGSIRTVLTEEKDTAFYAATFENSRNQVEEATFRNREATKEAVPTTLPWYNSQQNQYWSRLNGDDPNKRIGASIVLKVMAGDVIDLQTKAYYKTLTSSPSTAANQMVNSLANAFLGTGATVINNGKGNLLQGNNTILNTSDVLSFINNTQQNSDNSTHPKAYLTYVLFDENFNMVSGQVIRINKGADALNAYTGHLDITKSGYVYIYTSNESPVDVWFDDVFVTHQSGPLLQEGTYYPYGLEIASQSSRAAIRTANEHLYQGKELDEELGLDWYYFDARYYDPQTGRFISLDPARQFASGYSGMGNNPMMLVDPDGRWIQFAIGAALGAVVNVASHWQEITSAPSIWQGIGRGVGYGLVGGVSGVMYAAGNVAGATAISSLGNGAMDIISGHTPQEAAGSALMGVVTAPIGGAVSAEVSAVIAPVINSIKGPAIRMMIDRAVSQAVGAQVVGTGVGLMMGQNLNDAMAHALPGAMIAMGAGGAGGYFEGVQFARRYEVDPITGRFNGTLEKLQTVTTNTEISAVLEGPATKGEWSFRMDMEPGTALSSAQAPTRPYTKSTLKLGQEMHKAYKADVADGVDRIKEFRLPSGKRIDFIDIPNRTIYEYKPYNPRAINQGNAQLRDYLTELQKMPRFQGYEWKTVLETY